MSRRKNKQPIIDIASKLFSEFGFWGVSMEMIAKRLNITKPALYHHFKNKKDLYLKAVDDSFDRLMGEMKTIFINKDKQPKERLMEMSSVYLKFGSQQRSFVKIITHGSFNRKDSTILKYLIKLKGEMIELFENMISELYKNSCPTKKNDVKEDAMLLVGTMDGIMMNTSLSGKKEKVEQQLKKIISLISKVDS